MTTANLRSPANGPRTASGALRVLLIEDNPGDARLVQELLADADPDATVQWEQSLEAGIRAGRAATPDVWVVDLDLPDSTGVRSVERCSSAAEATSPVVVLTGQDDLDTALCALKAGAAEFLQKDELTARLLSRTLRWAVERQRMENELAQRNDWIRSITHNAPNGIYRSRPEGGLAYVNPAFVAMFGYDSPDEMLALDPKALYADPKERERLMHVEDERGALESVEVEYRRKDGTRFTGLLSSRIVRDDAGTPRHYDGVIADITARKKTERQLRMLSEAIDQAQEAVLITEAAPIDAPGPRVTYVNPAFEAMTGYAEDDLLGETPRVLQGPETDRDTLDRVRTALAAGEPVSTETVNYRKDGTPYTVQWNIAPVRDDDGAIEHWVSVQRDVTERKRDERALRESKAALEEERQRLDMALTGGTLGLWDLDFTTGRNLVDERWAKMLGYALDEIEPTLEFFESLVHPDDRAKVDAALRQHVRGETDVMSVDIRMRAKGGAWRWIRDKGKVMEWTDDGEPKRAVGTHQDITEHKAAEEELRREHDLLQNIFEASPTGIVIADPDGRIRFVNAQAGQILGLEEADIVGRPHDDSAWGPAAPDGTSLPGNALPFDQVVQHSDVVTDVEHVITCSDGTVSGAPLREADGGLSGVVFVLEDVTDRRAAERTQARLASIVTSTSRAILGLTPEGHIQTWNAAAEALYGYAADEVEGKHISMLVPPDRTDETADLLQQIRNGTTVDRVETVRVCKDGSHIDVLLTVSPILDDGTVVGISSISHDITERKQLEAQLRQAQKMETVGTLVGGIAHDFNNILHAATAYITLSQEDAPEGHLIQTYLQHAERGLENATELVRKLLTFSRPEQMVGQETVNLTPLVGNVVDLAKPSLPKKIDVRTHVDDACRVRGNAGQLQQVVMNLVTNAGQAMEVNDPGRPCILDVRLQTVSVDHDLARRYLHLDTGPYVHLAVSDTGPGIDAATRERIFDPFFTTKEPDKGTGLGLSVVHGIVQAHNGDITVYTQPGEGTTFNVYFPCADEDALGSAEPTPTADRHTEERGHVLVVDDEASVTELEMIRLPRLGYDVTTCQNAREALEAVRATPDAYDVVLTDYNMPGMNGLALARTLRDSGFERPIVLISGFSARISADEAEAAGISAFLQKPTGSRELAGALARLV